MNTVNEFITRVNGMLENSAVVTAGIDGLGGAGKSNVSQVLRDALENSGIHTVVLHIDDFITPREVRYNDHYPQWQCYYELQWRCGYLKEVVQTLKNSRSPVEIELYDKDNDSYILREYCTKDRTVILIEGIFLQRRELDGVFDLMAYIDVPEQERLERVLKRDTYIGGEEAIREKYNVRYFPAEHRYVSEYSPAEKADMILRPDGKEV